MSLVADRRGRVPFALVGVLLLVGATTYAAGLAGRGPAPVERPATETMDGTVRDARPALRTTVQNAARAAAASPVTDPADSEMGAVLNDSQPFVDALRVRIAVGARDALANVGRSRADVRTSVSLPAIDDAADLRRAKRDVELTGVDGNRSLRVVFRNVTVRATRAGRTIAERTVTITLVVETPVLALHERTKRYRQRLNRGPLEGSGLGRGVTARLYPVTWARAYGRYGGAPIQNVLTNRHVELSTNGALLGQQRAVFGRPDPDGSRAVQVATARVLTRDVMGPSREADWAATVLRPNAVDDGTEFEPEPPDSPPVNASPEAAADHAFLAVGDSLSARLERSYRVTTTLRTTVEQTRDERRPAADPPGANWSLAGTTTRERVTVLRTTRRGSDGRNRSDKVASPARFEAVREVIVTHTVTRYWVGPDGAKRSVSEWTDRYRVDVEAIAEYDPDDEAPDRSTDPRFGRGGALDGPNVGPLAERAVQSIVADEGGVDALVKKSVQTGPVTTRTTTTAEAPDATRQWVAADLASLRRTVAAVSVSVSRQRVARGDANPPARLAERLRDRRTDLVDAPATYDGVADRARVAARAAYLDAVIQQLESRAAENEKRTDGYLDAAGDRTAREVSKLVAIGASDRGGLRRRGTATEDGLRTVPDGSPAYLTLSAVDHEHVPSIPSGESIHPLAARNVNWFAAPYGDVADAVTGSLFRGEKRVSLTSASQALVAANRTADDAGDGHDERLDRKRLALSTRVGERIRVVERRSCRTLHREMGLEKPTCRRAVAAASARWTTRGRRGLAIANGSHAIAVGTNLRARGVDDATAERATVRLRVKHRKLVAKRSTAVDADVTNETVGATREVARQVVHEATARTAENLTQRARSRLTGSSRLPAGLPVAPAPGYWYATVNGWTVTVRGEYQQFVVRSYAGAPDGTGGAIAYVRDGSTVALDVDDDGKRERLGSGERIAFETSTVVVVAVPPGPTGVGDVDGVRSEESAGWPHPGDPGNSSSADVERATRDVPEGGE